MSQLLRRYGTAPTVILVVLTAFWLLVLVLLPYLYLFENSFRPYLPIAEVGGPKDVYSFDNYLTFFKSPIHIQVFVWTIIYSSIVTMLCFVMAYPLAYYLAKVASNRAVPTLFLLLLIPLWVSEILRSFAWFIILSLKGPLNIFLIGAGIIDAPIRWISGFRSIIIGLVYTYVLFMLFPIYNSIQSLDTNQIEAAEDLGSPWWRTHWRVVLPHAKPGIASGSVMVFMLSAGSILVPTLLASTNSRWFTEIIQQWMFESQDWNTGSAYAFLLLLLCTVFVSAVMRIFRVSLSDIAK
ncbi:ABC transporter permease [Mesorhizobium sp. VK23B]|uniref:ABC transporter permease n=1 Tax=Mesorhizobium dulcispinae TaxID=3072316 RepID=A0ABU4X9P4_9HYPH|nr:MULTISPECIES: ABC transporter permease [unclassified Mesorhizobium]MDX8465674.1 ABC transporter permease [Mesorhizobium sp. VK23B]MDX8471524.1 ABC transporter permease [Mesorhizobium sp. VK23A]